MRAILAIPVRLKSCTFRRRLSTSGSFLSARVGCGSTVLRGSTGCIRAWKFGLLIAFPKKPGRSSPVAPVTKSRFALARRYETTDCPTSITFTARIAPVVTMAVPISFPHSVDRPITEQRDDSTTSAMSGSLTTWSRLVVDDGTFLAGTQALTLAFRMSAQRPQADVEYRKFECLFGVACRRSAAGSDRLQNDTHNFRNAPGSH